MPKRAKTKSKSKMLKNFNKRQTDSSLERGRLRAFEMFSHSHRSFESGSSVLTADIKYVDTYFKMGMPSLRFLILHY